MKNITKYRWWYTESILKSSRYSFGDLYGMSYLHDFKREIGQERATVAIETCNVPRRTALYSINDSYIYGFYPTYSIFCGVDFYKFKRWDLDGMARVGPIEAELDTTKTNVLLIERAERFFSIIPLSEYLGHIKFITKQTPVKRETTIKDRPKAAFCSTCYTKMKSMFNMILNKNINQNLEFNLFDYIIFNPFKELKAQLNYKLFGRLCEEITIIPNLPYLFMSETIDSKSVRSSFKPIDDLQIDSIVVILNSTYKYYRSRGFDAVFCSIIPNPISIICPGYNAYNDVIRRVQNHPGLIMPMINMYDRLNTASSQVYRNSDSHWNKSGFNLWVNEVNKHLRTVRKDKN